MLEAARTPAKILVVDDYAGNREFARALLEDQGYVVSIAANGSEALAAFADDTPDCILLDVKMPGMDGFTVCERIRAAPRGSDTPIIFVTGMRDVDTFDRAALAGGDDYLTKPVQAAELLSRVRMAVRLRQLGSERRDLYDEIRAQRSAMTRVQLQTERLTTFLVHDLKLPVGSMALHAQSILQDPQICEDSREAARQIESDSRQLLRLILNLLDIGRSERGALSLNRRVTDLAALTRDVFAVLALSADTARISLHVDGEASHAVDPGLIRRTLANLLENAIRHAPVGSDVWVRVRSDDEGVLLEVADTGPGIRPERRTAVFDQASAPAADAAAVQRSGVGLPFCKLAVEAHGGRIWVADGDSGAILRVQLPHEPRDQE